MRAEFVELPAFGRHRAEYLDDLAFRKLQLALMAEPEAGDVLRGTGGLSKLRFEDRRRGKGKRGGLRVVYFWWSTGRQFWLFTVFDKDEAPDLTTAERMTLAGMLREELKARGGA